MHIGNLRTALYAFLYARKNNGKFILRIEDTDTERYVEGAVDIILDTLKKAGMDYDEGPKKGGPYGPYVQSERKNEYMKYALELVEKGENCSMEEIARDIRERDERDMTRKTAPLKKADDAVLVDSSNMSIQEVVDEICSYCRPGEKQ